MSETWTTPNEEKMIILVGMEASLFAKKDPNYKNTKLKEKKWENIAEQFEGITAEEVKKHWQKLRSQFTGFLRKLKKPTGTGAGARPYFRHENSMRFLRDDIEPNESTFSNVDVDGDKVEENGFSQRIILEVIDLPNSVDHFENSTDAPLVPRFQEVATPRSHTKYGKKPKIDFDKELLSILKTEGDEFDLYAKSLVPKFKSLSEKNRKCFLELQYDINNLVHSAEMRCLDMDI